MISWSSSCCEHSKSGVLLQVVLSVGDTLSVEDELLRIVKLIIATIATKPEMIHFFECIDVGLWSWTKVLIDLLQ